MYCGSDVPDIKSKLKQTLGVKKIFLVITLMIRVNEKRKTKTAHLSVVFFDFLSYKCLIANLEYCFHMPELHKIRFTVTIILLTL